MATPVPAARPVQTSVRSPPCASRAAPAPEKLKSGISYLIFLLLLLRKISEKWDSPLCSREMANSGPFDATMPTSDIGM